ncbi:hypothetical protein MMC28_008131 [Mycoblastus sanguinarius]|nr:hypothetical protein [Mycoblastus sanguinarius]
MACFNRDLRKFEHFEREAEALDMRLESFLWLLTFSNLKKIGFGPLKAVSKWLLAMSLRRCNPSTPDLTLIIREKDREISAFLELCSQENVHIMTLDNNTAAIRAVAFQTRVDLTNATDQNSKLAERVRFLEDNLDDRGSQIMQLDYEVRSLIRRKNSALEAEREAHKRVKEAVKKMKVTMIQCQAMVDLKNAELARKQEEVSQLLKDNVYMEYEKEQERQRSRQDREVLEAANKRTVNGLVEEKNMTETAHQSEVNDLKARITAAEEAKAGAETRAAKAEVPFYILKSEHQKEMEAVEARNNRLDARLSNTTREHFATIDGLKAKIRAIKEENEAEVDSLRGRIEAETKMLQPLRDALANERESQGEMYMSQGKMEKELQISKNQLSKFQSEIKRYKAGEERLNRALRAKDLNCDSIKSERNTIEAKKRIEVIKAEAIANSLQHRLNELISMKNKSEDREYALELRVKELEKQRSELLSYDWPKARLQTEIKASDLPQSLAKEDLEHAVATRVEGLQNSLDKMLRGTRQLEQELITAKIVHDHEVQACANELFEAAKDDLSRLVDERVSDNQKEHKGQATNEVEEVIQSLHQRYNEEIADSESKIRDYADLRFHEEVEKMQNDCNERVTAKENECQSRMAELANAEQNLATKFSTQATESEIQIHRARQEAQSAQEETRNIQNDAESNYTKYDAVVEDIRNEMAGIERDLGRAKDLIQEITAEGLSDEAFAALSELVYGNDTLEDVKRDLRDPDSEINKNPNSKVHQSTLLYNLDMALVGESNLEDLEQSDHGIMLDQCRALNQRVEDLKEEVRTRFQGQTSSLLNVLTAPRGDEDAVKNVMKRKAGLEDEADSTATPYQAQDLNNLASHATSSVDPAHQFVQGLEPHLPGLASLSEHSEAASQSARPRRTPRTRRTGGIVISQHQGFIPSDTTYSPELPLTLGPHPDLLTSRYSQPERHHTAVSGPSAWLAPAKFAFSNNQLVLDPALGGSSSQQSQPAMAGQ